MGKAPAKTFQDLLVWQKAHAFVLQIYSFSRMFPKDELFGLTSQFRRAAVSTAANIAEGFKRKSSRDKLRFYNTAQSSLEECRYYLILAEDLRICKKRKIETPTGRDQQTTGCLYGIGEQTSGIVIHSEF